MCGVQANDIERSMDLMFVLEREKHQYLKLLLVVSPKREGGQIHIYPAANLFTPTLL